MDKNKFRYFIVAIIVLLSLTSCTLPGFSTPTPFSFPTPDKTMTALFEPTQAAPATSAADGSNGNGTDSNGDAVSDADKTATAAAKDVATETPKEPTATEEAPTATGEPTESVEPTLSFEGPAARSGPSVGAGYMETGVQIDGDLGGWDVPIQKVINKVVYGKDKHEGDYDCSGTLVSGWNEDYLYLGIRVKDDKYVQEATKEKIYLGDSIEILFDRYVSADYHLHTMTSDDYQIGISPGRYGIVCSLSNGKVASLSAITCTAEPPEAYIWYPRTEAGRTTDIKIGVLEGAEGYQVEMKIPWSLLGVVNPQAGDHFGFAVSINDNDNVGTKKQQTVVSNVKDRYFADPTTWGDLVLE